MSTNSPGHSAFIGIVEDGLVGDRRRRRVDLVVDHRELAGREVLPVGALGDDFDVALSQLGANLGERGRGQRKADPDRADLVDGDNPGRVGRVHDVAEIDEARPDAAVDRRSDGAVAQLHLREIDLRLIGVHGTPILLDERRLSIELLVSHRILGDQTVIALQIELRILEQRLILDFHRLRLRERRRIGTRIDFGDDVPGVDLLALGEIHLEDLAVHPALDQNAIEGLHRAQGRKINRHVGVCGQVGHYGDAG